MRRHLSSATVVVLLVIGALTPTSAAAAEAPVAADVSATVVAGGSVGITLEGSDVDSGTLTYRIVSPPSTGSLSSVSGDRVTFTAPYRDGTVTFTYRANDGTQDSNTATVTVTVTPTSSDTAAVRTVDAGGTVSTAGGTATSDNPVVTSVTTPVAGRIVIAEGAIETTPPSGYAFVGQQVDIAAPTATVVDPQVLRFRVHESVVPDGAATIHLFRNGVLVPDSCAGPDAEPSADPDPCQASLVRDGEEWLVTVWTSWGTDWNIAVDVFDGIDRLAGAARILTAIEISRSEFAHGADAVVLARADAYPDALAGAPLAAMLGAPILLTDSAALPREVIQEIGRLGVTRAVLLGGEVALGRAIVDGLVAAGIDSDDITRYAGANRFDTARLVAEQFSGTSVYVTEGADPDPARGWPDAVAVSALASFQQRPVLLVTTDVLPAETSRAFLRMGVTDVTIVGGPVAVSREVEGLIRQIAAVGRIDGPTRYETSKAVAEVSVAAGMHPTRTWFATGRNFPDALAAGPAVAADGGVLLLTLGQHLADTPSTQDWVATYGATMVRTVLVGGKGVLTGAFADELSGVLP